MRHWAIILKLSIIRFLFFVLNVHAKCVPWKEVTSFTEHEANVLSTKISIKIQRYLKLKIGVRPFDWWYHPIRIQCWACAFSLCCRRSFWPFGKEKVIAWRCCFDMVNVSIAIQVLPIALGWCHFEYHRTEWRLDDSSNDQFDNYLAAIESA